MDMVSLGIAGMSLLISVGAVYYAHRSVNEAHRSADAAELTASIQQTAAHEARLADVRALCWVGSISGRWVLQLENIGPAVALDVVGEIHGGEASYVRGRVGLVGPGVAAEISELRDYMPSDAGSIPLPNNDRVVARVTWRIKDGSTGLSDWTQVPIGWSLPPAGPLFPKIG